MRDFNIVTDFTVTLFNEKEPLPINYIYGRIKQKSMDIVYIYNPWTSFLEICTPDGGIFKDYSMAKKSVVAILNSHKEQIATLQKPETCKHIQRLLNDVHAAKTREHRVAFGAPHTKRAQSEYIYRSRPLGGEWRDDTADYVPRYERGAKDAMSYFEVGQNTAGPAAFVIKRNAMNTNGVKTDSKEYQKIHFTEKSFTRKDDPVRDRADAVRYEAAQDARCAQIGAAGRGH